MNDRGDFWSQDRTIICKKPGWFDKLPPLQKFSYVLLLVFIIGWCFYLGLTYAFAIAPEVKWQIKDHGDWKQTLKEETGEEVMRLSGVEVAVLVGADKRAGENRYRTDTIMLAFYDGEANELRLLSIPRDTYVQFPGKSTKTKINEAYFYGGITLLESVIEYTFGIEVDHWVEIDFHGFLELIDALGGVEIDVKQRMYKPTEEINIQKGLQTLNGYDTLGFVRFRDLPMGDIDRIANQQIFIRALAAKIAQSSIWKAPQLVTIGWEHIDSNYEFQDALMLGSALYKTDLNSIPMYSLPGRGLYIGAGNYWVLDKQETINIIAEITGGLAGDFHIISDEGRGSAQPAQPQENATEEVPAEGGEAETPPLENAGQDEGQATGTETGTETETDAEQGTAPTQEQPEQTPETTQPEQPPQNPPEQTVLPGGSQIPEPPDPDRN